MYNQRRRRSRRRQRSMNASRGGTRRFFPLFCFKLMLTAHSRFFFNFALHEFLLEFFSSSFLIIKRLSCFVRHEKLF